MSESIIHFANLWRRTAHRLHEQRKPWTVVSVASSATDPMERTENRPVMGKLEIWENLLSLLDES